MIRRLGYTRNSRMLALYVAVATVVLAPLLRPGFVLTLDMVFTPHLRMPSSANNSYLFYTLLHVLNYALPAQVIQKILLFGIFVTAGAGMHRLLRFVRDDTARSWQAIGPYAAGLLYTINPFTYDRLMAGQYGILLGYALLPFCVQALLRLVWQPTRRTGLVLGAWATGLAIVSIHALGLLLVITLVGGVLALAKQQTWTYARRLGLAAAGSAALFIILSSYWLAPLLLGKGSTAAQLAQFSAQDTTAFATVGDSAIGKLSNVVRLQGFWAEDRSQFTLPQDVVQPWGIVVLVLWIVVIAGLVLAWRNGYRFVAVFSTTLIVLGVVLSSGIGSELFASHVPLFGGFREPQKFAALLAIGYSIGVGFGVTGLVQRLADEQSYGATWAAAGAAVLFPFLLTPTMIWGANDQLTPRAYPAGWFAANQLLDNDHSQYQTLFLPWHLYMNYGFAGRIIASPAPSFFDKPVIVSDDPEFDGAAPAQPTRTKRQLDRLLPGANQRTDLGTKLAGLHVKYILLTHDDDYTTYDYLQRQPQLTRVYTSNSIDLYRNSAWRQQ